MSLPRTVAEVINQHVTLEVEAIDRMYLNAYQPKLQLERHVFRFLREQRGQGALSSRYFAVMTQAFVQGIEAYAQQQQIPLITFSRKQRKDEVAAEQHSRYAGGEGIVFIGKAQEKVRTFRTEGRLNATTGQTYPWLVSSTAMVNQYYFYGTDEDFGPFFIKFSSYFPYGAKLCLNGHEYLKRQLAKEGIAFEALDNGIRSCANPKRMQKIADGLTTAKIDALLRKWLTRLPHPFTAQDRAAGYRYDLSVIQAEFARTQVLDRPVAGRIFFEEVIRENLDLGRPDNVQLIFARRVTKRTPGRFRTRVVTEGVLPSLYVDYQSSRIKQYFKEGQALRTETTINNTYDFGIGRALHNLPKLREVGFAANRRLLEVERLSHDCMLAEDTFQAINRPVEVGRQRASGLRFADPRVHSLWHAIILFRQLAEGFRAADLRRHLAALSERDAEAISQGAITYQLRRLRLHGFIERLPHSFRYRVTAFGFRAALFFTRLYNRLLRPGLAAVIPTLRAVDASLKRAFDKIDTEVNSSINRAQLAA
jgi:hypothetical protein